MREGKQLEVQDLKRQLNKMGTIVRDLERKAREAEEKGWNLLICAIGAELEAFREGEGLFRGVVTTLDPSYAANTLDQDVLNLKTQASDVGSQEDYLKNSNGNQSSVDHYDDAREELFSFQRGDSESVGLSAVPVLERKGLERRDSSPYRSGIESEDDGPPAALLVGVQDDDG
jgi:hypothetical protein